ncbi:unnamed protein product, partial [Urochloa humidicola]
STQTTIRLAHRSSLGSRITSYGVYLGVIFSALRSCGATPSVTHDDAAAIPELDEAATTPLRQEPRGGGGPGSREILRGWKLETATTAEEDEAAIMEEEEEEAKNLTLCQCEVIFAN